MKLSTSHIRNFVIIAHVDHGKSTLADRLLELTGTIEQRKMREQFLDQMDLERERGITIKMQPVRMHYFWREQDYQLNLIDTPGHVDFSYEVSRALAAVEGAILLVDASQGVQAQTIANLHLARREGLMLIPVMNKIDLASARVEETADELVELLGCARSSIIRISAKTGLAIHEVIEAVIERVPSPDMNTDALLGIPRALIFDSHFDAFRGIIAHVRVVEGVFARGNKVRGVASGAKSEIMEVGFFSPQLAPLEELSGGEIGYIATGLKEPDAIRVGDTLFSFAKASENFAKIPRGASYIFQNNPEARDIALVGYQQPKPVVFASVYPENQDDYERLRDALKKIRLNDGSLSFEPESSDALGRGFRAGFLGMLHMEIIAERLRREYALTSILATPSVAYRVFLLNGSEYMIYAASRFPDSSALREIHEPWVRLEIITPQRSLGNVLALIGKTRGVFREQRYLSTDRLAVMCEMPLRDILVDFFDSLKGATEGYGSLSYEMIEYRRGDLVRLDILVAGEREEALSQVVARDSAYHEGRALVEKLKELLPRQLFSVSIQASVGGQVIARETLSALKKDVTGYLYGGDRTRKMKLWKKQQRGKKRLKAGGRIEIPPSVFLSILKRSPTSG